MKIEFEILDGKNVDRSNFDSAESYPGDGLFEVDNDLILVKDDLATWLGNKDNFKENIIQEEPLLDFGVIEEKTVSEEFALKLLAVATGKVENVDLNDPYYNLAK